MRVRFPSIPPNKTLLIKLLTYVITYVLFIPILWKILSKREDRVRFLRWGALWSMYGVRKYRFSSGSIPEDSSVKNIEIISMNQSLMVSGAYGNAGNLI